MRAPEGLLRTIRTYGRRYRSLFCHRKDAFALQIDDGTYYAVRKPVTARLIEAHLLTDDPGDLLGRYLAMDFIKHLRDQKKFKTEKDLSAQIEKDCQSAEEILDIKNP